MGRYRSRSRSRSRSYSPRRSKRYDEPRASRSHRRDTRHSSPAPSGLLIRNISLDARPEDLRVPFEKFGPLKDVYLPKNYYTGEPRGFGFVKFRYPEDAAEAKDHLNHTVIGGREIRIVFAEENRKTPHEMRKVTRPSDRGSYRRRSPVRSPGRRYRSPSRSYSPARSDRRDRGTRDDKYSPRRSRSVSRSISPHDDRDYRLKKSEKRSRSLSRSPSPLNQENHRSSQRSPAPGGDSRKSRDEKYDELSRSPIARERVQTPSGSQRSPTPRGNGRSYRDERSPIARSKVHSSSRSHKSPSPTGNGQRSPDERNDKPRKSPSARRRVCSPSRSYSPR